MRRTPWCALWVLASGCYLSHAEDLDAEPAEGADDPAAPGETSPCVVVERDCGYEAVRRGESEPDEGAWCCPFLHSLRAVAVGEECVFDTEACLAHEDVGEIRRPADVAEVGPTLRTVEGVAERIETPTRNGPELALSLDGGLVLSGAPCGPSSSFGCFSDGSCGPLELGRSYRVTGWAGGVGMVCRQNGFDLAEMVVVSWAEVRP